MRLAVRLLAAVIFVGGGADLASAQDSGENQIFDDSFVSPASGQYYPTITPRGTFTTNIHTSFSSVKSVLYKLDGNVYVLVASVTERTTNVYSVLPNGNKAWQCGAWYINTPGKYVVKSTLYGLVSNGGNRPPGPPIELDSNLSDELTVN